MVSHLQYADDTIIFGKWSRRNARNIMGILKCYEEVAGLKINLRKSKLYEVGVDRQEVDNMARFMGCGVGDFPFTYLGLPIGVNMRRTSAWYMVIEKFKSRLSEWKAKTISFGGRLTLVKSILGSLPLYYFSKFRVPSYVISALERIRKKLSWGGIGDGKRRWWRFNVEKDALWRRVVCSIYGYEGGWSVNRVGQKGGGVWADIIRVGGELEDLEGGFRSHFVNQLGDGLNMSFWADKWVGDVKLCERYLRLFHPEEEKWVEKEAGTMGFGTGNGIRLDQLGGRAFVEVDNLKDLLSQWVDERQSGEGSGLDGTKWNNLVTKKVKHFLVEDYDREIACANGAR
ncbi:putative RNA-directed DNA polymerase, eukaryota, reverse transcriptase zinc-binding domain protein [Tanacetum coccineum]